MSEKKNGFQVKDGESSFFTHKILNFLRRCANKWRIFSGSKTNIELQEPKTEIDQFKEVHSDDQISRFEEVNQERFGNLPQEPKTEGILGDLPPKIIDFLIKRAPDLYAKLVSLSRPLTDDELDEIFRRLIQSSEYDFIHDLEKATNKIAPDIYWT
jgi:hypothetical protein